MKKHIALLFVCTLPFLSIHAAVNSPPAVHEMTSLETSDAVHPELVEMLKKGEIKFLTISYNQALLCTLSAELSYNGVAIKLSITAETCEKAGAGLAQAVKSFMKEVQK